MIHYLKINLSLLFSVFLLSLNSNAQSCQDFEISLINTSPAQSVDGYVYLCVGDTLDIDVTGYYPNDGISYSQSDSLTNFLWFFHGGNSGAEGTQVSVAYDNPGIHPIICNAIDTVNCENSNEFILYAIVSGPNSVDINTSLPNGAYCLGDSISLIANTVFDSLELIYSDTATFTYNNDSLLYLPDGTGEIFEATIQVPQFMDNSSLSLENLIVCLDIEHSFLGDLEIKLTCPTGEVVTLHNFSNFSGGGYYLGEPIDNDTGPNPGIPATYCFSPFTTNGTWLQSAGLIGNDNTLPPGHYSSFQPLSNLYACNKSGDWTLSVEDFWGVDNGYLFSWSLGFIVNDSLLFEDVVFDSIQYLPELVSQYWELPNGDTIHDSQADIVVGLDSIYIYTLINELGCEFSYDIEIEPNLNNPCVPCTPYFVTDTTFTICPGDTLSYLGNSFTQAGIYSVNPDSSYCQNPVEVTINEILMPSDTSLYICPGDTIVIDNQIITTAGVYSIPSDSVYLPCFPTYTATVTEYDMNSNNSCYPCTPYPVTDTTFTICSGDTLSFLGNNFTQAGIYSVNPDSSYCQNPVEVTINEILMPSDTSIYICPGDTLILDNQVITIAGIYDIPSDSTYHPCFPTYVATVIEYDFDYEILTAPTLIGQSEGSIEVTTTGYYIDNGDSLVTILDSLAVGFYDIVITDGTCSEMTNVEIVGYSQLVVDVSVAENFTGSNTFTATANITGGWPDYTIEWSTGDIGTGASISGLEDGQYWVKVTDALGNEVIYYFTVGSVSNQNLSDFESVDIFPNPTSNILNIKVSFNDVHDYNISLYNILGEHIFMMNGQGKEVSETRDLQQFPQGVYLLEISANGNSWVEKITIQ